MKDLKLFVLKNCPFCKRAMEYIDELKQESAYRHIKIHVIDEREHEDIARLYDYYYVPCFYLDEQKVHEGSVSKEEIQEIFDEM